MKPGKAPRNLSVRKTMHLLLCVAAALMTAAFAAPAQQTSVKPGGQPAAGAHATAVTHWAFRAPTHPAIPKVSATVVGTRNPIDAFLLSALQRKGLTFAPPADRRTLLRRVTFDLIGLPPTPQEMDAFLADKSPDAYAKVVGRLLADPRYGEQWARHWLDTAGYADSEGILEEDRIRPNAWRYRDYVIRSLNRDKPYDQFLREQIAGDELVDYRNAEKWTPEIEDAITATGFLRTAVDATRDDFNTHQFTEYQYRMLNDTEMILVSSTLGITLQCARCHDHKYEPFSQKDYYRVQAILAGAIRPTGKLLPTNRRQIIAGTAADQKHAAEVNAQVTTAIQALNQKEAALIARFRRLTIESKRSSVPESDRASLLQAFPLEDSKRSAEQKALAAKYKAALETTPQTLAVAFPEFKQQYDDIQKAKADEEKKRITLAELRALYDQDAAPPPTPLLIRGEWTRPGEMIPPGIPSILDDPNHPFRIPVPLAGAATTGRRKALADWITRSDNPLTARVIVNRLWAHHFGVGIVASVENFGRSGAAPTNPPLLDWLATELTHGIQGSKPWTLKALQRLIVTSAAYRQSSAYRAEPARIDPEDRLLWRQRSRRLEAESIRDAMLAVTGTLDPTLYGEPIGEEARPTGEIVPVGEEKGGRRSLYLLVRRSRPVTLLNTFDAPVMETNCTRRVVSTTATQALALLNSNFVDTQAHHFAAHITRETTLSPPSLAARSSLAYRLAYGRQPSPKEQAATLTFLHQQSARYIASGKPAVAAEEQALTDLCHVLLSSNEFVYID